MVLCQCIDVTVKADRCGSVSVYFLPFFLVFFDSLSSRGLQILITN